ncbi:MAG: hypothetical protein B7X02_01160 [Rhodospirillales bacterium 12-54-5]|nr:MAG: hypothetical protein B7X02_01160 [Rhodospirillales bacterium 12-54-5]
MNPITVSTFYYFTPIEQPAALKAPLLSRMRELGIRGTITLAHEGINATISGARDAMDAMLAEIRSRMPFNPPTYRETFADAQPFQRSKVKVKRELISIGAAADPRVCVGQHIAPEDWNALISQPDIITIDTRNQYEFELGHFTGAINPATRNFKQMLAYTDAHLSPEKTPRVAMYCTGGIRCEKYSSYLMARGFTHVYHLEGGILAYLEKIPASQSLWQGTCFVFDERETVGHRIAA